MKVTGGKGKNGRTNIQRNNDKTQVWLKKKNYTSKNIYQLQVG